MGKVIFVGAGPGDVELITVKGLKAVQHADVILYDALVSTDLLSYARAGCRLVYVGKRKAKKEFPQEEINHLLVFYAQRHDIVVRLKGGDPHVFGRGHEEMSFVAQHGLFTETIPGISSAIAAPSSVNIPLTKRGVNESFWVITGTLSTGEMSGDISIAAQSSATIVILMGVSHLQHITAMIASLRSPQEPIAVIQHATCPTQKVVVGTASDIEMLAAEQHISSPAVIVIGKVVDERRTFMELVEQNIALSLIKNLSI